MAIYKEWLIHFARAVVNSNVQGPAYMFGDTECYFTADYARQRLRDEGLLKNPQAEIHLRDGMLAGRSFLAMLGVEPYFDVDINEHASIRIDLSVPLPDRFKGVAGAVIDVGTTEHVFNVAQAFGNVVEMLAPGGTVIHLSPVSWFNHGFYNFNPLLFNEFYAANGFQRLDHGLIVSPFAYPRYWLSAALGRDRQARDLRRSTPSWRIRDESYFLQTFTDNIFMLARAMHLFLARKGASHAPVVYPVQGLYAASAKDFTG